MARDQSTGLVLRENLLEWTALQRSKAQFIPVGSGRADLPAVPPEATDEEKPVLLAERIARLKSASAGLSGFLSATLPSDRVLLRVVELPTLVDAELKEKETRLFQCLKEALDKSKSLGKSCLA